MNNRSGLKASIMTLWGCASRPAGVCPERFSGSAVFLSASCSSQKLQTAGFFRLSTHDGLLSVGLVSEEETCEHAAAQPHTSWWKSCLCSQLLQITCLMESLWMLLPVFFLVASFQVRRNTDKRSQIQIIPQKYIYKIKLLSLCISLWGKTFWNSSFKVINPITLIFASYCFDPDCSLDSVCIPLMLVPYSTHNKEPFASTKWDLYPV